MSAFQVNSLEKRLHLGLALSLVLLMLVLWLMGSRFLQSMTEDFIASRLEHDAEALLGSLMITPHKFKIRPARINQVYLQPFSGHYFVIRTQQGRETVSRSLWDFKLEIPQLTTGEQRRFHLDGPNGQKLLVRASGFSKQGIELTIAVAEDVTPIAQQRGEFLLNFALLSLVGLALLLFLQHWVVRRSFRRLEPLRQEIKQLAETGGQKISEDVPTEIRPLVQEVNHLLTLLTQRNERSRNALGNLAHALKGPLNLLIRFFDRLSAQEEQGEGEQSAAQARRIQLLIERELKRARMAGMGAPSQRFDPQQDLSDLVAVVKQIHQDRDIEVEQQIEEEQTLFGDREDMFELIGNLLDNAFKWATGQIRITIAGDSMIRILVEDDGEGLSDQQLSALAQRGSRLDESVEGHGLGLSIAMDIAKLYGGGIEFDRSPDLGGLRVTVSISGQ
ncbi:MAG: sensor histidine kinase [Candidatus Thiodiazotropha sp. (ex Monitilora ramsayi)]|nr:sensor histidine kinase [Candidatus Thiodiazotropha sp. (ex Monitilora ramsayi)]